MSAFATAALLVLLGALYSFIHRRRTASVNGPKLPPGPWALPIFGNLHMLGNLPHRNLSRLARKYGPIMSMRLGYVPTIVVSSPEAAELFLKTHDAVFASRPKIQASEYLCYGRKGMAFTEYGPYWRNARKLCTLELLTKVKIDSFAAMRKEELGVLVQSLKQMAAAREVVNISKKVGELIEDMTHRMLFGRCKDYQRADLKALVQETLILVGAFNIADYVPFLGALDLQGLKRRMKAISGAVDHILEKVIDEHKQDASENQGNHKDFVDVMLSLMNEMKNFHQEPSYLIEQENIKGIVWDIIIGAIDTSATTIEWLLSELFRHPRVMRQLQEELENVIGMERMVEEVDLANLVYLDMVLKEGLRLHPAGPLLLPHESIEDITLNGYYIPKKSRIIINAWAIGRDPNIWSNNVEDFFPERFIGSNIDFQGKDFQFIPFGSGRRKCPGMQLGLINVRLVLAQLVHCFDWKLPNGMLPSELDMSEEFGLALPRATHLHALPTYRLLPKV
ncbi:cytochrome P450 CYP736A12 [Vitis vinifera]|uniref:cytochrome P450 CYP736A12 n=1 Tax=Vitis vinifera TaxID=29760 RepID=UPI00015C9F20|nr:cytochrome P450 CYP736A12 [Vitis vinifera]|eukprot:XP_002275826.1 PREDICTED: cytochrome P450 CYP736A12 [Vitis vinifera]